MKNYVSKNKIKILLVTLLVFFILFIQNDVKAVSYDTDYYFGYTASNGKDLRVCANEDFYLQCNDGSGYVSPYSYETNEKIFVTVYLGGSDYYKQEVKTQVLSLSNITSGHDYYGKGKVAVYDSNQELVFQLAPLEEKQEIQKLEILQEIMEQERVEMSTMQEILGILPLILSVLVSLIALRKGLAMLFSLLNQS